jgi:hypothetical protein
MKRVVKYIHQRSFPLMVVLVCAVGCDQSGCARTPDDLVHLVGDDPDVGQGHDGNPSLSDVRASRDQGRDVDVDIDDGPDVWDDLANRCAPEHPTPTAMSWGEEQERPAEVAASVAWARTHPCEGMNSPQGKDWMGQQGSMVLTEREGTEVLAVTHELPSVPEWSGEGVKALAWLDLSSGVPIECDAYPDGRGITLTPIHSNPWAPGSVVVATSTHQDDVTAGLPNESPSTIWWSPQWNEEARRALPDPIDQVGASAPQSKLLPDGQLLLFPRNDRLVSVDAVTGELNWVVRPRDIREALRNTGLRGFSMSRASTRFDATRRVVRTRVAAADGRTRGESIDIEIDACGGVTAVATESIDEAMWERIPFGEGSLEVGLDGRQKYQVRVRDGDQTLATLSGCQQVVTLAHDRVGCFKPGRYSASFQLEQLTWPARRSSVGLNESNSTEAEIVFFYPTLVSLRGGVVMLYALYSSATEGRERILLFDWRSGEVLTHVEYTLPPDAVVNEPPGPALVTSDGMIVVQNGGYLTGISTNMSGLSPTYFPRGVDFGRNDNLGIWIP